MKLKISNKWKDDIDKMVYELCQEKGIKVEVKDNKFNLRHISEELYEEILGEAIMKTLPKSI